MDRLMEEQRLGWGLLYSNQDALPNCRTVVHTKDTRFHSTTVGYFWGFGSLISFRIR